MLSLLPYQHEKRNVNKMIQKEIWHTRFRIYSVIKSTGKCRLKQEYFYKFIINCKVGMSYANVEMAKNMKWSNLISKCDNDNKIITELIKNMTLRQIKWCPPRFSWSRDAYSNEERFVCVTMWISICVDGRWLYINK